MEFASLLFKLSPVNLTFKKGSWIPFSYDYLYPLSLQVYHEEVRTMKLSENTMKWVMRFYPPLFFQRIWVKRFHPSFTGIDVVIYKSIFNRNYNASIFGGTIYSAADPFYPILFDQLLKRKGFKTLVWLKSGAVKYIKPARTNLNFSIQISDSDIQRAEEMLLSNGKFVGTYHLTLYDQEQQACAWIESEIYIRDINFNSETKR